MSEPGPPGWLSAAEGIAQCPCKLANRRVSPLVDSRGNGIDRPAESLPVEAALEGLPGELVTREVEESEPKIDRSSVLRCAQPFEDSIQGRNVDQLLMPWQGLRGDRIVGVRGLQVSGSTLSCKR